MLGSDPHSYKQDFHDPRWKKTMDDEYDLLQNNNTWDLISLSLGRNLVQCKWIYKTKLASDGSATKYKARLVAKGYSQVHGLYFNETFTPVGRMESIRLVFSIATSKKWEVHHMYLKSDVLHGDFGEEIYMIQTDRYTECSLLVCRLRKYMYGIKQSLRAWYAKVDSFLLSQKFEKCKSE